MIRKLLLTTAATIVLGLLILVWTFAPERLPLPSQPGAPLPPVPAVTATIGVIAIGILQLTTPEEGLVAPNERVAAVALGAA